MRSLLTVVFSVGLAALPASQAAAQACLGLPGFDRGVFHLNLAADFPESAKAYAGGIGAGKHNGLFGNIGGGRVSFENPDGNSSFGFVEAGWQIPLGGVQLCPVAGGYYGIGPNDDAFGLEISTIAGSAGLALGVPLRMEAFSLVPNASVKYEYARTRVSEEGFPDETLTGGNGLLDLGLALIFGGRFSLQPLAHIPFAMEEGEAEDVSFGLFLSIGLGGGSR